jgi:murein hydrolase activator
MQIKWLKYCVVLGCLVCIMPGWAMTEEERQAQLKALRATIEQLQKDLNKARSSRDELLDGVQESEAKMNELNKKMEALRKQLEEQQAHLKQLQKDKEALVAEKKQQGAKVALQLNSAYRLGEQSSLKLLLNQQRPDQFERQLKYYHYFAQARAFKLSQYNNTLTRIDALEPQILAETQVVESQQQAIKQQQQALAAEQANRKKVLNKLNTQIASADGKLKSTQEDRHRLETLIIQVVKMVQPLPDVAPPAPKPGVGKQITADMQRVGGHAPLASLKGKLPWPVTGRVVQNFGTYRIADKIRWDGIVIAAQEGTPVKAIHKGQVVFADYLRGQGLLMILDHGGGYMSLYAHNQQLNKKLGDWVKAGEILAKVGDTGGQMTPGLYFEMRYRGEPTNPRPWLRP